MHALAARSHAILRCHQFYSDLQPVGRFHEAMGNAVAKRHTPHHRGDMWEDLFQFSQRSLALESLSPSEWRAAKKIFPDLSRRIGQVNSTTVGDFVQRAIATAETRPVRALYAGAGRDAATVGWLLAQGVDEVVAVDKNGEALKALRAGMKSQVTADRLRTVCGDYWARSFMYQCYGAFRLMVAVHLPGEDIVDTALNCLEAGGLFLEQHHYDNRREMSQLLNSVGCREFNLLRTWSGVRPFFHSPWSEVFPSGNFFTIYPRRRRSELLRSNRFLLPAPRPPQGPQWPTVRSLDEVARLEGPRWLLSLARRNFSVF